MSNQIQVTMAEDKKDPMEGNQFWKLRSKHGRNILFESPELLWESACEYFKWCDDNPLKEEKAFHYQGKVSKEDVSKMRAYTLNGLCLYLGCSTSYFRAFKSTSNESKAEDIVDFLTVIGQIETTIYEQKFTGAAADLLNPNIIARDLGLIDRKDMTSKDKQIKPPSSIDYSGLSTETLKDIANNTKTDEDE